MNPLLIVRNLTLVFNENQNSFKALDAVNFKLERGESVGLVGPSGSGKTLTAQSIVLPMTHLTTGEILFEGENLLTKTHRDMRLLRGKKIGFIPQDPFTALNPTMRIGQQVIEALRAHLKLSYAQAKAQTLALFAQVELADPASLFEAYAFQLSGGMCQRVMIAMAIACQPSLLIADEPTTALDVITQMQIIKLLKNLKQLTNSSLLFITHDLKLAHVLCDRLLVMNQGKIIDNLNQ